METETVADPVVTEEVQELMSTKGWKPEDFRVRAVAARLGMDEITLRTRLKTKAAFLSPEQLAQLGFLTQVPAEQLTEQLMVVPDPQPPVPLPAPVGPQPSVLLKQKPPAGLMLLLFKKQYPNARIVAAIRPGVRELQRVWVKPGMGARMVEGAPMPCRPSGTADDLWYWDGRYPVNKIAHVKWMKFGVPGWEVVK